MVCHDPIISLYHNFIVFSISFLSGLVSRDGMPLNLFEIAGEDRRFVSAQAGIAGDTVVVWSDKIVKTVAVRFAWHEEAEYNLMNRGKLPASPFRTDTW